MEHSPAAVSSKNLSSPCICPIVQQPLLAVSMLPVCCDHDDTTADSSSLPMGPTEEEALPWHRQQPSGQHSNVSDSCARDNSASDCSATDSGAASLQQVVLTISVASRPNRHSLTAAHQRSCALALVEQSALQQDNPLVPTKLGVGSDPWAAFVSSLRSNSRWVASQSLSLPGAPVSCTALMLYTSPALSVTSAIAAHSSTLASFKLEIGGPSHSLAIDSTLLSSSRCSPPQKAVLAYGPQFTTAVAVYGDFADAAWRTLASCALPGVSRAFEAASGVVKVVSKASNPTALLLPVRAMLMARVGRKTLAVELSMPSKLLEGELSCPLPLTPTPLFPHPSFLSCSTHAAVLSDVSHRISPQPSCQT